MPRRTLLILCLTAIVSYACYRTAHRNQYARYFSEIMQAVDDNYVESVDDRELYEGAVRGMVGRLDPFSLYIDRRHAKQFHEMVVDQRFDGIGIMVGIDSKTEQLVVKNPIIGAPAYEGGIQAGDRIVKIDGRDTTGADLTELSQSLRGPPGSEVTLEVVSAGETMPRSVRLVREQVKVNTVLGYARNADDSWNYWLPGHDRIGYVRVASFGDPTADELADVLAHLSGPADEGGVSTEGLRGLILDLRDNPGGLLDTAAETAGMFLNQGDLLVTTRGRDAKELERWEVEKPGRYRDLPLVVLINRDSASASEIVAAALADHHRATIVGERTYGKGTVQTMIPVEGGRSVLKLTTATYWRPSGKNIHRFDHNQSGGEWGVTPDAGNLVELSKKQFDDWRNERHERDIIGAKTTTSTLPTTPLVDPQLDKAVERLEEQLVGKSD